MNLSSFCFCCCCLAMAMVAASLATQVPYSSVSQACQSQLERLSASASSSERFSTSSSSSSSSAGGDNSGSWVDNSGSWIAGSWIKKPSGAAASFVLVQGQTGSFDFSSFDSLQHLHHNVVKNVSGHFYLGSPSLDPIPQPVIMDASGVLDVASGELCLACCLRASRSNSRASNASTEDGARQSPPHCLIRATLRFQYPTIAVLTTRVTGTIESLANLHDPLFFPPITLAGVIENIKDENALHAALLALILLFIALEFFFVILQICYTFQNASEAVFVSTLGISVQVAVLGFRWLRVSFYPVIYSRRSRYRHLWKSRMWVAHMTTGLALVMGYMVLIGAVWHLRRKKRGGRDRGLLPLLSTAVLLYLIVWLVIWWMGQSSETFLEVLLLLWLLPQVAANAAWDLRRIRPFASAFILGVSGCRLITLAHSRFRPSVFGYDDVYKLPKSWFWGLAFCLNALVGLVLSQQAYGGRWFIPKRDYGYQQLQMEQLELRGAASSEAKTQVDA